MKIYIVNEERFSEIDCYGFSPLELLKHTFGSKAVVVNSEKEIKSKKGEVIAVLYADTPLVDEAFVNALAKEKIGYAVGDGYIGKVGDIDRKQASVLRLRTLGDAGAILAELSKKVKEKYVGRNVLFYDFDSCHIDLTVEIADGAVIHPNNVLRGKTVIGKGATVFSFNDLTDTVVGEAADVRSTFSVGAIIGDGTTVGPFATLRKGAVIGKKCRVGDYVEIKNSTLGDGTKAAHLAYVGDATVGNNTNIGCGTVFANYNGKIKQRTAVGNNVFIGANTNLIAPLDVADGAYIAAGSTVTHDIPESTLCIARSRQIIKYNWDRK